MEIWQRKIIRNIFGGVKDRHGQWRKRTNVEVKTLYEKPTIINKIRDHTSKWLGHIIRLPNDRMVKGSYMSRG